MLLVCLASFRAAIFTSGRWLSLAALLAEETGASPGDLTSSVVANTLIGIHRAFLDHVRQRIVADPAELPQLARALQADSQAALDLLAEGLAGYGVRLGTELAP